jgi:hypothetical protein
MGGPDPGIDGNIKITGVFGNKVTFRIPRYCAVNPPQSVDPGDPYFIQGFLMTMDAISQAYKSGITKTITAYVKTESTDYSLSGDVVDVTISAEDGVLPHLEIGDLYSCHFINQYPVE